MLKGQNTLKYVIECLGNGGYGAEGIKSAKFSHINATGKEVHVITFRNEDTGKMDKGNVYISEHKGDF